MITGRILDRSTRASIANAVIEYEQLETNARGTSRSGISGDYFIPLLPPGSYRIRVSAPGNRYQAGETQNVVVSVAGYKLIDFELRPSADVWEKGRYGSLVFRNNTIATFFGPDIDPSYAAVFEPERSAGGQLEPSISDVIDPKAIATLPLAGRDVYTALVLQPGVTADNATIRSLGLSANGQRVTASNFLLDGVEENDSLLGGPAIQLAPEMIGEYRVSTNNFSAEYGRTSGYIANAVTRAAASAWHGILYGDLSNSVLNANTFQHNAGGMPRNSVHQIDVGFSVGGAVPRTRLLTWTGFDYFGSRGFADATIYQLPTRAFYNGLPQNSQAHALLTAFKPTQWANSSFGDTGPVLFTPPVTFRRIAALERIDYALSERQHVIARFAGGASKRPDFNWSPYGQAPLSQNSLGGMLALTSRWSPLITSDMRISFLSSARGWDLLLPDLPRIGLGVVSLPGHCCEVGHVDEGWRDRTHTTEISGSLIMTRGPHLLKAGAGVLDILSKIQFTIPSLGSFAFKTLSDFATDRPYQLDAILSRISLEQGRYGTPDTRRSYSWDQLYLFLQEDWRASSRLSLNLGVRYDRLPAPKNIGSVPDVLILPGTGATFDETIASATVAQHDGTLFSAHPNYWGVRLAFSYQLLKATGTVIRGGYGTFYDRAFGNSAATAAANDLAPSAFTRDSCPLQQFYRNQTYKEQPATCIAYPGGLTLFDLTLFKPGLETPRIQSYFLSLQQPLGRNLRLEVNGAGSNSSNLTTKDVVNRQTSILLPPVNGLPNIDYRTNQGISNFAALSTTLRYRTGPTTLNASYTWSHSIDNQSDPLLGEYFDLGFSNQTDRTNPHYYGAFTFEGDRRTDRGNSDFDQRHDFVGWISVSAPTNEHLGRLSPLFRNWSAATVFAVRSGLPYSVYAGAVNCSPVCNTRANLVNPAATYLNSTVPGGVQLLNPNAFDAPPDNQTGNTGRNSFGGPGFYNIDVSLSRSFPLRCLGGQTRIIVRADVFNLLNHVNLQNPQAYLGYRAENGSTVTIPGFGVATYGRTENNSGFPTLTPLIENARQLHFLLRIQF